VAYRCPARCLCWRNPDFREPPRLIPPEDDIGDPAEQDRHDHREQPVTPGLAARRIGDESVKAHLSDHEAGLRGLERHALRENREIDELEPGRRLRRQGDLRSEQVGADHRDRLLVLRQAAFLAAQAQQGIAKAEVVDVPASFD